jgi:hypothetical protein
MPKTLKELVMGQLFSFHFDSDSWIYKVVSVGERIDVISVDVPHRGLNPIGRVYDCTELSDSEVRLREWENE